MGNKLYPTGKSVTIDYGDKLNVADANDKNQIKEITITELIAKLGLTTSTSTSTSTTSTSTSTTSSSTSSSTSTSISTSTTSSSTSTTSTTV